MKNKRLFTILTASILFCILTFSCTKFEEGPGKTFRLRSVKHRLCESGWEFVSYRFYANQSMKESNSPMDSTITITNFSLHFSKNGTYNLIINYDGQDPNSNPQPNPVFYKYKQLHEEEGKWWFDKKDKTILYMTFDGVTEKMKITSLNKSVLFMFHIDDSTGIVEDYRFF